MIVRSLDVVRFRNIERAALAFSDTFNFITGRNAQGKTNLLEAIHFFSLGRSFKTRQSDEAISFGEECFYLRLGGRSDSGVDFDLEIGYERGGRVRVASGGSRLAGLSEIIGIIPSVLFVPEDVLLAAGPPAQRRLFLDYTAALISPAFLSELKAYRAIVRNRNALLRGIAEGERSGAELEAWDEMMVQRGAAVVRGRIEILAEIRRMVDDVGENLLPKRERLSMEYVCSFNREGGDPAEALRETLGRLRENEVRRGCTLAGPHYDDVSVYLGEVELRRYGSQGRKRLVAVMLKLAQAAAIMSRRSERPIVLLDDIFSELDHESAMRVRGALSDRYQSFVTSPRGEDFEAFGRNGACFEVEGGVFSPRMEEVDES